MTRRIQWAIQKGNYLCVGMTHESKFETNFIRKFLHAFFKLNFSPRSIIRCKVSRISQMENEPKIPQFHSPHRHVTFHSIEEGKSYYVTLMSPFNLPLSFLSCAMTLKIIMITSAFFKKCEHFRCCHVMPKFCFKYQQNYRHQKLPSMSENLLHETQFIHFPWR